MNKVSFDSFVVHNKDLYFSAKETGLIMKYNIRDKSIQYIPINLTQEYIYWMYRGMCVIEDKIIMTPYNAKNICIYNTKTDTFEEIDISCYVDINKEAKFIGCKGYGHKVYFFGFKCKGILVLDIKTYDITTIFDEYNDMYWSLGCYQDNNMLYLTNRNKNEILKLNMETADGIKKILPMQQEGYKGITWNGEKFILLASDKNEIYTWDGLNTYSAISVGSDKYNMYSGIASVGNYVILYSNRSQGKIFNINNFKEQYKENVLYADYDSTVGIILCCENEIKIYNSKFQLLDKIEYKLEENLYKSIVADKNITNVIQENKFMNLETYINKLN